MKSFASLTLGGVLAVALLLTGCGQQPRAEVPTPDGYVTMQLGLSAGQLAGAALEAQGVPFTSAGSAGAELVSVSVFDKNAQPVAFTLTPGGYMADPSGTLTTVPLTPANESATLTLLAAGNPYQFVAHGYGQAGNPSVIAYDAQTKLVGSGTTVTLGLKSVLGSAVLVPRYPANYAAPSAAPFDLLLVVTANGYSAFPGGDYLQVPLGDFAVQYGAVTGASVTDSSDRGLRLVIDECQVGVAQGHVAGLVWNGSAVVPGQVTLPAYGIGCQTSGANLDADLQAPTVSISYDAATLTVSGTAQDANDRIAKVQVWDGAKLLASTDPSEESAAVAYFQFALGLDTFSVTLKEAPLGGLQALAFDPAGNEGQSATTFTQANVWVDASAAAGGDGSEAQPFTTIGAGVSAVGVGGTVWVRPGSYPENVVIAKDLKLLSTGGASVTSIVGQQAGGELGTVVVSGGTSGFQLGAAGHGFHIVGIDGPAGIEKAAVYFQGAHSGAAVIGNDIEANGDAGLTTEYGAAVAGLVISQNRFTGQTFLGANPAGDGFSQQFSLLNVPRQLVVVASGATFTSFTDNTILGTAGGLNAANAPQGNTLVTLDGTGGLISGNEFAGYTTRYGTSLRVRGAGTTIVGNTFQSTSLPASVGHVLVQNNALDAALVSANTFDKGVWVASAAGGTIGSALPTSFPAAMSDTVVNVLPGTYAVGAHIVALAPGLTLRGPNADAPQGTLHGPEAVIEGGVAIAAANVTVSGLSFTGFGAYLGDVSAIYLAAGATGTTISNNVVTGAGSGRGVINAMGGPISAAISGNHFEHLTTGAFAQGGATYTVSANLFSNNEAGVGTDTGGQSVTGNTFTNNAEGVGLGAAGNTVTGNTFGAGHASYVTDYTGSYDLSALLSANTFSPAATVGTYLPSWTATAYPALVP